MTLQELYKTGEDVVNNLATVGAALDHVHLVGKPVTESTDHMDQVEVGMGIHNEPGCYVIKPQPTISSLVDQMLDKLLDPNDPDRAYVSFSSEDDVCLMVNNLGGVSNIEFSAMTKIVVDRLGKLDVSFMFLPLLTDLINADKQGLKPTRLYSGSFMTSLDGKGFSITLLKANAQMLEALNAPATTPGWSITPRLSENHPQARYKVPLDTSHQESSSNRPASPLKGYYFSKTTIIINKLTICI